MGKLAYIFPGQGSQHVGMGKDLCDNFPAAKQVFEEANDALGFSLSDLCFSGTEEDLALTANTQPAILTTSVAAFEAMKSEGFPMPSVAAGHSLGEYSALVAAGAISLSDAVKTVRKRGEFMQSAVPVGVGAMAAILALPLETIEIACDEAANGEICSPANINSPSQVVIAGNAGAIDRACEILKTRGAKRAVKLNVSAPFHCDLMLPAQEKLEKVLAAIDFNDLKFPIVENVSAQLNSDGSRVAKALTKQVSSPVRWSDSIVSLVAAEITAFVEVGAGKILCGLVRQINRDAKCFNVENKESLESTLSALNELN
ncbi:MAG: ACP S-malonyltransferase [Pyrinomonadaceae bacterium]|nr:ACP S-malonyltransferase [Pyrinomonadaceae bacterium]